MSRSGKIQRGRQVVGTVPMARFSSRASAMQRACSKCQAPAGHRCRTTPKTASGLPSPGWYPKPMAKPHEGR